jgi:uncharacterized protein (DUF433 family)
MPQVETAYEHIVLDETGTPVIEGANTKVVEVVIAIRASGISPEQLHLELPHLGLGQFAFEVLGRLGERGSRRRNRALR